MTNDEDQSHSKRPAASFRGTGSVRTDTEIRTTSDCCSKSSPSVPVVIDGGSVRNRSEVQLSASRLMTFCP